MTLTTNDLAGGLSVILLVLLIAALVTAFTVARARRRASTTLALDVADRLSLAWIFLCGIGVLVQGASALAGGTIGLDEAVRGQLLPESSACEFAGATSTPALDCYGQVVGAPMGARVLVFVGILLGIGCSASIAWAIHVATRRAADGTPFHASVPRTFAVAGTVFLVGSIAGELTRRIGMTVLARSIPEGADASFTLEVPLWPFAVALGCFALAAIFRQGERLEREKQQLENETKGLV